MRPQTEEAYQLLHDGAIALAEVEAAGMRVDVPYLNRITEEAVGKIRELTYKLKDSEVWGNWRRKYGEKANLTSDAQLTDILFKDMGYEAKAYTATGRAKADVEALEKIDHPFVKDYVRMKKLSKLHGTYLTGLQREVVDGLVHPFFHLHKVVTYRSSSSDPNFQNLPIRDGEIAEMLRTAFIPRDGHLIIENDFKGIEVCASACYNRDPVLIEYIKDPTKDMHRDCAAALFCIPPDSPYWKTKDGKNARYVGKNQYVFPGFYGSYYIQTAAGIWLGMREKDLHYNGDSMEGWLATNGIYELGDLNPKAEPRPGTFEKHVKEYENWYWHTKYVAYSQWKKDWVEAYQRTGGFLSLTGFYYEGIFERNQVLNYTIQGSAFHWLLWVLIRMVKWLKKNKMQSKIVGQIHDSILGDVHESEKDDYLAKMKELVTEGLRKYWSWICVPLTVEAEITDVNGNWFAKRSIEI